MTPQRLRLHLFLIITLSGVAAFLSSVLALAVGATSMTVRYPLAVACGYAVFVLLIRGWIGFHQRHGGARSQASDLIDIDPAVLDVGLPARLPRGSDVALFSGGRSGGGGAGASWFNATSTSASPSIDLDVDEFWPVLLAVVCVLGGALAIGYVIYSAPILLAEVAVDAAIVSGVYRQLKRRQPSHWAMTVVRHTALPALVLMLFAALGGYAAHWIAPDARSIGGVIRALSD